LGALGLICLVLSFTGCTATGIDAITVSPTITDFEGVGGSVQLTAIATINHGGHPATYENITNQVSWSTPLAEVAQVNSSGYVTLIGYGVTQITATAKGYQGVVSGSATVCAQQPPPATNTITCPSVGASFRPKTTLSFVRGERTASMPGEVVQFRVIGTTHETGAEDEMTDAVTWSSTNESVATVSRSGLVTSVGRGTATIMATLTNEDRTAVAAAANFTVGSAR
jgi:hypothetical protein